MDKKRKDELIDTLLVDINDYVESTGYPISCAYFSLSQDGLAEFMDENKVDQSELEILMKTCFSREYIKRGCIGSTYDDLLLTDLGQGRARSVDVAKYSPEKNVSSGDIHIQNLHTGGNTQIGHNNVQNVETILTGLIESIDKSDKAEIEKKKVKNLLAQFIKHPITATIIGGTAVAAITKSCGG